MSDAPESSPELEKLRKLLRRAQDDASSESERETAMRHALRIAATAGIDLDTVDIHADVGVLEPFTETEFAPERAGGGSVTGRLPTSHLFITFIIQRFYGCTVIVKGTTVQLVGRQSKVAVSTYVYKFLYFEFQRRWRQHKQATQAPIADRRSFYYGLYASLSEKLDAELGEIAAELQHKLGEDGATVGACGTVDDDCESLATGKPKPEPVSKFALVLASEAKSLEEEVKVRHPRLKFTKADTTKDVYIGKALEAGLVEGKKVNLRVALK